MNEVLQTPTQTALAKDFEDYLLPLGFIPTPDNSWYYLKFEDNKELAVCSLERELFMAHINTLENDEIIDKKTIIDGVYVQTLEQAKFLFDNSVSIMKIRKMINNV